MSKKETERLEEKIKQTNFDLLLYFGVLLFGMVLFVFLISNVFVGSHNTEWQCTQWEETDEIDFFKCRIIDLNLPKRMSELRCEHKKVCTQEMLVRDVN